MLAQSSLCPPYTCKEIGGPNEHKVAEEGCNVLLVEGGDIRGGEVWVQRQIEGDFHGTVEG